MPAWQYRFENYLAAFMTASGPAGSLLCITFILAVLILKLLVMTLDVVAELPLLKASTGHSDSWWGCTGSLCGLDPFSADHGTGRNGCRKPDSDPDRPGQSDYPYFMTPIFS